MLRLGMKKRLFKVSVKVGVEDSFFEGDSDMIFKSAKEEERKEKRRTF